MRQLCWDVYTQALLKMTGANNDCSLGGAFDRQVDDMVGHLNTILAQGAGI